MSKESKVPQGRFSMKPEEEVGRQSTITLRPYHHFVLQRLAECGKSALAPSQAIQSLIEEEADRQGITKVEFDALEDKSPYMKGRLPAPGKKEYKRKDYIKKNK